MLSSHTLELLPEPDRNRQLILERCGWQFWRVRGSEYFLDPEAALQSLWKELDHLGIEIASDQFDESAVVDGYVPRLDMNTAKEPNELTAGNLETHL